MEWIILEALVSLAIGLSILWWALSPARRRERDDEQRDAEVAARDREEDVR